MSVDSRFRSSFLILSNCVRWLPYSFTAAELIALQKEFRDHAKEKLRILKEHEEAVETHSKKMQRLLQEANKAFSSDSILDTHNKKEDELKEYAAKTKDVFLKLRDNIFAEQVCLIQFVSFLQALRFDSCHATFVAAWIFLLFLSPIGEQESEAVVPMMLGQ